MVNLKEILLSLPQQDVFIKRLKEYDEVDIFSWSAFINFSQLFPVEKSFSEKLVSSCVMQWNYGSLLQRHAEFRNILLELCQPVAHHQCARKPQGRAFPELGSSLQKTDSPILSAVSTLWVSVHGKQSTAQRQHTPQDKKSAAEQRYEPVLALRSVHWWKDYSSTFGLVSSHMARSFCWTSILDRAPLFFNCESIRNTYFPRVYFGLFFLEHWKLLSAFWG